MCKMSNFLFSVHNLENNQVENKTCNHKKKLWIKNHWIFSEVGFCCSTHFNIYFSILNNYNKVIIILNNYSKV